MRGGARRPWLGSRPNHLADRYYDATTWVYRWAWGSSFHFAPLRKREPRHLAIRRYEEDIARRLDLCQEIRCLDLGCGVGGPARTIESLTKARIVAINSNFGQLHWLRRTPSQIWAMAADFSCLPFRENTFDRAYAFEALCHAVDLEATLREVLRVLRPEGTLGISEWSLTEKFDPNNTEHRLLKRCLEVSYGVVRLRPRAEWTAALQGAGFSILEATDRASTAAAGNDHEPWYRALLPRDRTFDSFTRSEVMRDLVATALRLAERCHIAPPGTGAIVHQLRAGTKALVEAGRRELFSPMTFFLATKPAPTGPI